MAKRTTCVVAAVVLAFLCLAGGVLAQRSDRGLKNLRIPLTVNLDNVIQHHSLLPPFLEEYYSAGLHHWDFGGSTAVTDEYVRLTPAKQSREGWLWNDVPSHLSSWTVNLGFRVHSRNSIGADGFGLWYVESAAKQGGSLFGGPDRFKGLGIIFDTFDNNGQRDNPGVSIIMGDGNEVFRTDNDLVDQRVGGCAFNLRNTDENDVIEAIIDYNGDSLRVTLHSHERQMSCATVSPITLPDGYYFGLTAHTGNLADHHDIHYFIVSASQGVREAENTAGSGSGAVQQPQEQQQGSDEFPMFDHEAERAEKDRHRARQ